MESFKNLCAPAIVYLVLVVVGIISQIMGGVATFFGTLGHIIIAVIWTWLLNFICKSGYVIISWILVFLPIIFGILLFVFVIKYTKEITNEMSVEEKKKIMDEMKKN